ncbi:MAG: hypothetical protein J6U40_07425 [Kiritimatiellae bacterium]|nr:hypothetical protein [Kiritimatiellia bacterium]
MNEEIQMVTLKDDASGKGSGKDLFTEEKVKMVMSIYGVSREKALEFIANRTAELAATEEQEEDDDDDDDDETVPFISVKEFLA